MPTITECNQVGALLLARRRSLKLSQAQVAERLGLSQNRLSELESRPARLTLAQLLALSAALGLELQVAEAGS